MRRLTLVLMVAGIATLATGCVTSSGGGDDTGFIRADWSFHNVAGAGLGCPGGFTTAAVTATPTGGGTPIIDLYDCPNQTGNADYPLDQYDVDIDITSEGGGQVYASSLTQRVDIVSADATVAEDFIDDGGRLIFDWALVGVGNQPVSCADVGAIQVGIDGSIGMNLLLSDELPCGDGTGISIPTVAGNYIMSISALDASGGLLGQATNEQNVVIDAPNGYTDLGVVTIVAE